MKCGFATNEPHPGGDVLQWLKWNDSNLKTYPKWVTELQSHVSHQLQRTGKMNVSVMAVAQGSR